MTSYILLPWPPSVNHYWRSVNGRAIISAAGRDYRQSVADAVGSIPPRVGRLDVHILAAPPDRRRRDLDNLPKALLDGLQHAGAYEDDSQIDRLTIERCEPVAGGCIWVQIRPAEPLRVLDAGSVPG